MYFNEENSNAWFVVKTWLNAETDLSIFQWIDNEHIKYLKTKPEELVDMAFGC